MRQLRAFVFSLAFVILAAGVATAQTFFSAAGDFYGEHRVVGAEATSDGRFVLAFQSDRYDVSPADDFSVVVKLNDDGSVLWERRIAGDDPGGPIHAIDAAADGTPEGCTASTSRRSRNPRKKAWVRSRACSAPWPRRRMNP